MKEFELTIKTTFHKNVTVEADTIEEAIDKVYNDGDILDSALDTYDFETTVEVPSEEKKKAEFNVIIVDTITNKYDFYYQINGQIYHIQQGTGDNLDDEDIEKGYIDYIYYDVYNNIQGIADNNIVDGGMILLDRLYQNLFLQDIIKTVIDFVTPKEEKEEK